MLDNLFEVILHQKPRHGQLAQKVLLMQKENEEREC